MSESDLTPDTPYVPDPENPSFTSLEGVQSPAQFSAGAVTGSCGPEYVVQPGDTLSQIAAACGLSLHDLINANLGLSDPNMIQPGQKIFIPAISSLPVPDSGGGLPLNPLVRILWPSSTPDAILLPGAPVEIEISGFPPHVVVAVEIGKEGEQPHMVGEALTDADGYFKITIRIPAEARPEEMWVVKGTTGEEPKMEATTRPFRIGQ